MFDVFYVTEPWYIRPVFLEDEVAPGVVFNLCDAFHPRCLESEVDAADAGEQRDEFHLFPHGSHRFSAVIVTVSICCSSIGAQCGS